MNNIGSILICGYFYPSVGGIERIVENLATSFSHRGIRVSVCTPCLHSAADDGFPFRVYRNISPVKLALLARKHDVVLLVGLSLKSYLPAVLSFRPVYISHQTLISPSSLVEAFKLFVARRHLRSSACSRFVSLRVAPHSLVIKNPVDLAKFLATTSHDQPPPSREGIVFVGRLDAVKGCSLLINAIGDSPVLKKLLLNVIGDGPERDHLMALAHSKGVNATFNGSLSPNQIAEIVLRCDIFVVPSMWAEPFGIVALEGLASGCRLVVSDGSGLEEASNGFGALFSRGDKSSLIHILEYLVNHPSAFRFNPMHGGLRDYLVSRSVDAVASEYLAWFVGGVN